MMGVLTYVSVALVHECHAGSLFSKGKKNRGVEVDDKRTIPVKQGSQAPQQDLKNQPPQQPPTQLPQQSLDNAPKGPPTQKIEENDERRTTVPVQQQPLQQSLNNQPNNAPTSSQPAPQPLSQLPQQSSDNASKVTPPPVIKTDEGTLVPYKIIKFKGHEIPYPQSAKLETNENSTLLKQTVCSITLLTKAQKETNELVKKIEKDSLVPQSPEFLNKYFEKIYSDLAHIGKVTNNVNSAEEAIHTLKKLVQTVELVDIFSNTRFQRNSSSRASRVMITLNGADEVIIFDVHGLR